MHIAMVIRPYFHGNAHGNSSKRIIPRYRTNLIEDFLMSNAVENPDAAHQGDDARLEDDHRSASGSLGAQCVVQDGEPGADVLSRKEMKRKAKEERMAARKAYKKARQKEKKEAQKQKKKEEIQALYANMTPEEIKAHRQIGREKVTKIRQDRRESKERLKRSLIEGQRIVIDFDFESYMHQGEIKSTIQQTMFTYGINASVSQPCHLILTSIKGAIEESFQRQKVRLDSWHVTKTAKSYLEHFAEEKDKLVYLTAEAEDEIHEIHKDKIYVVGGIVDKNRHKGLCYARAKELGIATARLPINQYMHLSTSQVMCTNHVVEILIRWQESRDWKQAFDAAVPLRKQHR